MKPGDFLDNLRRFWDRVDRDSECWIWTGERNNHGYGRFEFWHEGKRSRVMAHRLAYQLTGNDLPENKIIIHACDNPPCVNPQHLSVGTQTDNMRDARDKGRINVTGLDAGRFYKYPTRPCRTCATALKPGRALYCEPCRLESIRESQRRKRAKQKGTAA